MKNLLISKDLPLPPDVVTQRLAFLGKPGSGKSYGATGLAELIHDLSAQFVALDPVGIWYGLRMDGTGKGLAIPVFGGLRGDIPLEASSGAMIADLIVDRKISCVLDVSQFEHDTDKAKFAGAFAGRFFFRMKSAPSAVHVFLEECQEFVPQNPQRGEESMLHNFTRMSKLGRNFGIGMSLITQRPQEVNKKVLNLTECLFAFQMTGAHERKAIKEWITHVGADENMLNILPSLPVGQAHVYSPQWLKVSKTVKIAAKRTADVSSTPLVGASKIQSKPLAPVDLEKIREQMKTTIEKAKAEDPRELRKRIVDLEKQLSTKNKSIVDPAREVVKQEEIDRAVKAALRKKDDEVFKERGEFIRHMNTLLKTIETIGKTCGEAMKIRDTIKNKASVVSPVSVPTRQVPASREEKLDQMETHPNKTGKSEFDYRPSLNDTGDFKLGLGEKTVLIAIAQHPEGISRSDIMVLSGYRETSAYSYLKRLNASGCISKNGEMYVITSQGIEVLGDDFNPLPTGEALREHLLNTLPEGEKRLFSIFLESYPDPVEFTILQEKSGYKETSVYSYIKRLSAQKIIAKAGPKLFKAADKLFELHE
jgi:hypothetical protein